MNIVPKFNYAPSMASAATQMGISKRTVRNAKRRGCKAIRPHGTVEMTELREWLDKHDAATPTAPKVDASVDIEIEEAERRSMVATALTREHRLKLLLDSHVPADDLRRDWVRATFACKSIFGALPRKLSKKIATMTDPVEISELLRDEIITALGRMESGEWPKCRCPHCKTEIKP